MKTTVVNTLLLLVVIGLVSVNILLRADPARRQIEVMPDMAHSIAYHSYASNPNFADGRTLRPPVSGTVIRGRMPLHYAATPEEAKRAGIELVSTVAANDAKAIARGQWVYAQFCHTCHGPSGKGDGIVATRGFPMPASLLAPRALQMPDGQMFHVLTYGQGNMPSYAAQVDREDRWKVIEYVRTLQGAVAAPPLNSPPASSRVIPTPSFSEVEGPASRFSTAPQKAGPSPTPPGGVALGMTRKEEPVNDRRGATP